MLNYQRVAGTMPTGASWFWQLWRSSSPRSRLGSYTYFQLVWCFGTPHQNQVPIVKSPTHGSCYRKIFLKKLTKGFLFHVWLPKRTPKIIGLVVSNVSNIVFDYFDHMTGMMIRNDPRIRLICFVWVETTNQFRYWLSFERRTMIIENRPCIRHYHLHWF